MYLPILNTIALAVLLVPFNLHSQSIKGTYFNDFEIVNNIKTVKVEVVGIDNQERLNQIVDNLKKSNDILEIRASFDQPYCQISFRTNKDFIPENLRQLLLPLGADITLSSIFTDNDDLKRQISYNEKTL